MLGAGGTPALCNQDISQTGFLTTYKYDGLDNLIQINQGTLNPRTFTYNSLSELVCVANPETNPATCPTSDGGTWVSGTQRFGYDLNGNLVIKISPAPNQTSASTSVSTAFGHDSLNRRTSITPPTSWSEPGTQFFYDTQYGGGDKVGRLTGEGRTDSADGNWYTFRQYTYDPLGRVTSMNECTVQNCPGTNWVLAFGYDFLGDLTSWTNGYGNTFSATYDDAQRLTGITNNLSNSNYPSPMFTATSTGAYNAAGQLLSAQIGTGSAAIVETRTYDKLLRPTSLTDGSVYSSSVSKYAPNGSVLASSDSANGSWNFGTGTNLTGGYDDLNRLVVAVLSWFSLKWRGDVIR